MTPPREKIEKIFMAASADTLAASVEGPFASAAEAEAEAGRRGWGWVIAYTHVLDDRGKVVDSSKRCYQPGKPAVPGPPIRFRTLEQIKQLHRELSTPNPPPMDDGWATFFATYERQMGETDG